MHAVLTTVLWVLVLSPVWGSPPRLDAGRFGFRATVEGEVFEATFGRYVVTPSLDARRLPTGFEVEVEMGAIDSGDAERDAEMRSREWFDVTGHPTSVFSAKRVAVRQQGGYVAQGRLTLKGLTHRIDVPFDWYQEGNKVQMRGQVDLDRRWFAVGPDDDSSVAATVSVFFDLRWEVP